MSIRPAGARADRWPTALRLALRVTAGTALFALVLVLVQSGDTRIAGMMLTFPALNGMSLMMAPRPEKREMAAAMLPVIALNGLLAHAFIFTIGAFGGESTIRALPLMPWLLVAIGTAIWLAACVGLSRLSARMQWRLLTLYLGLSLALIFWWWPGCLAGPPALVSDASVILARNAWRIALFAATLGGLLALAEMAGTRHGWLGRLGAFPILPLFSLAIIATTGHGDHMMDLRAPILSGLLLAMSFAWVYAGVLQAIEGRHRAGSAQRSLLSVTGLVIGWLLTAAIVYLWVGAADILQSCAA